MKRKTDGISSSPTKKPKFEPSPSPSAWQESQSVLSPQLAGGTSGNDNNNNYTSFFIDNNTENHKHHFINLRG